VLNKKLQLARHAVASIPIMGGAKIQELLDQGFQNAREFVTMERNDLKMLQLLRLKKERSE